MIFVAILVLAAAVIYAWVVREQWEREDAERPWSVDVHVSVNDDEGEQL